MPYSGQGGWFVRLQWVSEFLVPFFGGLVLASSLKRWEDVWPKKRLFIRTPLIHVLYRRSRGTWYVERHTWWFESWKNYKHTGRYCLFFSWTPFPAEKLAETHLISIFVALRSDLPLIYCIPLICLDLPLIYCIFVPKTPCTLHPCSKPRWYATIMARKIYLSTQPSDRSLGLGQ